jgi:hypothetical protein
MARHQFEMAFALSAVPNSGPFFHSAKIIYQLIVIGQKARLSVINYGLSVIGYAGLKYYETIFHSASNDFDGRELCLR